MNSPRNIFGLVAVLATVPFAEEVAAQTRFEITPFAGGTFFLSDPPARFVIQRESAQDLVLEGGTFTDMVTFGVNLGLELTERMALEGMFSWVPTDLEYGVETRDVNTFMYAGSFVFTFPTRGRAAPFLGLGAGGETVTYDFEGWQPHTDFMGNVLAGVELATSDRTAIRFEARDCVTLFRSDIDGVDDALQNDLMLTVGLTLGIPIR